MKLTYRSPPYESDDEIDSVDPEVNESKGDIVSSNHIKTQWDDDCPWTEWYSAEDPIRGTFFLSKCSLANQVNFNPSF